LFLPAIAADFTAHRVLVISRTAPRGSASSGHALCQDVTSALQPSSGVATSFTASTKPLASPSRDHRPRTALRIEREVEILERLLRRGAGDMGVERCVGSLLPSPNNDSALATWRPGIRSSVATCWMTRGVDVASRGGCGGEGPATSPKRHRSGTGNSARKCAMGAALRRSRIKRL
jgi:hypothetical protein